MTGNAGNARSPRGHPTALGSLVVSSRRRAGGKVADITGPGITDQWGATCADQGASVLAPNGTLVSVFGDTFAGDRVGRGDWRSPVILIGTGDADHRFTAEEAPAFRPGRNGRCRTVTVGFDA